MLTVGVSGHGEYESLQRRGCETRGTTSRCKMGPNAECTLHLTGRTPATDNTNHMVHISVSSTYDSLLNIFYLFARLSGLGWGRRWVHLGREGAHERWWYNSPQVVCRWRYLILGCASRTWSSPCVGTFAPPCFEITRS